MRDRTKQTVYGVGFLGNGEFNCSDGGSKNRAKSYLVWSAMISRCYNIKDRKYAVYGAAGVTVCEDWKNYQNYAKWYNDNHVEGFAVDKDYTDGDKEYSPETCEFIPVALNSLLCLCDKSRGDLPLGVSFSKRVGKYRATCRDGTPHAKNLGFHNTIDEAFSAYKKFKESHIKKVAVQSYSDNSISDRVYNYLMNYEVSLNG